MCFGYKSVVYVLLKCVHYFTVRILGIEFKCNFYFYHNPLKKTNEAKMMEKYTQDI